MNPIVEHTISLTGKLLLVNVVLLFLTSVLASGGAGGVVFALLLGVGGLAVNVFLLLAEVTLLTREQLAVVERSG